MKQEAINQAEPLTAIHAAAYLKVSISTLHKWTSKGIVPFFKPNGRVLYFKREDLDAWVFRNRSAAAFELADQAGGR
jgi:excisionase family DNA binding protein